MKKKTCKICKVKYEPLRPLQQICSPKCAYEYQKKQKEKAWRKEKKERKEKLKDMKIRVNHSKNKDSLQREINKLARMIDAEFYDSCIDCGAYLSGQVHGSHFHNVGGNENVRYNLHNIHSSTSQCNKWKGGNKVGYQLGLKKRYGDDYFEMVDTMRAKYPSINLNEYDVIDKLKIVRKIIRDFDTYKLYSPTQARRMFNKMIGIYK
jgi:hypothetical protein